MISLTSAQRKPFETNNLQSNGSLHVLYHHEVIHPRLSIYLYGVLRALKARKCNFNFSHKYHGLIIGENSTQLLLMTSWIDKRKPNRYCVSHFASGQTALLTIREQISLLT